MIWRTAMLNLNYLHKLVDQIITVCGRATGLYYYLQLKKPKSNYKL